MTRDEFERNQRRFGDTVGAWPAPFRQQALALLGSEAGLEDDPDAMLDRLVLESTLSGGDDHALARKVLARIDRDHDAARPSWPLGFLLAPAGLATCAAAALLAATVAGYQVARLQDDLSDSALLALASGAQLSDAGGVGVTADAAEEDSL